VEGRSSECVTSLDLGHSRERLAFLSLKSRGRSGVRFPLAAVPPGRVEPAHVNPLSPVSDGRALPGGRIRRFESLAARRSQPVLSSVREVEAKDKEANG
jgi:hypothetical protein